MPILRIVFDLAMSASGRPEISRVWMEASPTPVDVGSSGTKRGVLLGFEAGKAHEFTMLNDPRGVLQSG